MFEAVTARPAGESTVARLALSAAEFGYDGIVVRNPGNRPAEYDRDAITAEYDVDVVDGVEITADDPSRASGFLGNHRPKRTIVAVRGGTDAMNRFAVEHPAVDVLARPFGHGGNDGTGSTTGSDSESANTDTADEVTVDHVLTKTAAENGVRVEISLAALLRDSGGSRVRGIQSLRKLWELVEQYDTPYVVTAGAGSHLELRAQRELVALGDVIGLSSEEVTAGLTEWQALAERNRKRQSDAFVEPGVWNANVE